MDRILYFDNNATTAVDPAILKVMQEELSGPPANPSSIHTWGRRAKNLLGASRKAIAFYLHVKEEEILFTSGGTEGINMLVRGLIGTPPRGHIITSDTDHASLHNTLLALEKEGCELTPLSSGLWGAPHPNQVEAALRPHTRLIALSAANSETGVKLDYTAIAAIAKKQGIPFLLDGVALLGKENFTIPPGITAMAFSGHKIHAPKGSGFVFLRSRTKFSPLLRGGPQEFQKRAGTENLAAIIAIAEAIRLLDNLLPTITDKMEKLRNSFEEKIFASLNNVFKNGKGPRIPNTSNLAFGNIEGEILLITLDKKGLLTSHGSACSSGALTASRTLLNMGIDPKLAKASLRFSLSRNTTEEEVDLASKIVIDTVKDLRKLKK